MREWGEDWEIVYEVVAMSKIAAGMGADPLCLKWVWYMIIGLWDGDDIEC